MSNNNSDDDLDYDPELAEKERHEAGIRSLIDCDNLAPVSATSWAAMEASGIRIIFGDASRVTYDCAAFCLLHSRDEQERRIARSAAFRPNFSDHVIEWLESHPEMHAQFADITEVIKSRMEDYTKILTRKKPARQANVQSVIRAKKNGRRTG